MAKQTAQYQRSFCFVKDTNYIFFPILYFFINHIGLASRSKEFIFCTVPQRRGGGLHVDGVTADVVRCVGVDELAADAASLALTVGVQHRGLR